MNENDIFDFICNYLKPLITVF